MTGERDITFCLKKFGDDTKITGVKIKKRWISDKRVSRDTG